MTQQAQQQTKQQQMGLARRDGGILPFVPRDMEDAWRTSELLSKASLIPDDLRGKPHDVLVAVLTGAELGISPMQAIREVYVVRGRPFIASLLRVAMVRQSPECLMWQLVESTAEKATFRTQRRGDLTPTTMTFTMKEAISAGLPKQNPKYNTDPALMLRRRCASRLIDEVYPDIVRGVGDRDLEEDVEEVRASAPATVRQLRHIPSTSAPPSPAPEVVEAQEVTPAPAPPPEEPETQEPEAQEQTEATATEPAAEPSLAEVILAELPDCQTIKEVDALSKRAADIPRGPERDEVGKAFAARRNEIRGAR